jgi:hypothetical protein
MQRKPLYLAAAIAELARFFALSLLAGALGAMGSPASPIAGEAGLSQFYRYATAPQLLFVVAFFFLWYDFGRYRAFRPLLILGKAISLLDFLPFSIYLIRSAFDLPLAGSAGPAAAICAFAVDLGSLLVLCLAKLPLAAADDEPEGKAGAAAAEKSITGPRDPSEIEEVEG